MSFTRSVARIVIGGLFVGHGTQKLAGWFGGSGLEGTAAMMDSLQLHPPRRNALAAGLSEAVGGGLLALGLATPLAAASVIGTMITAIRTVHLKNGPWVSQQGYEYNLVLIAVLAALAEEGPGRASLDHALGIEWTGSTAALAALGLGAAASTAVVAAGRAQARAADAEATPAGSQVGPAGP